MTEDLRLVQQYAATRDAEALAAIVKRYGDMVYAVCLRVHGDPHAAQDSAQQCFLKLMRNAATIRSSPGGWLHRCATSVSLDALRAGKARGEREREYADMNTAHHQSSGWEDVSPCVDAALNQLPDELREVLVEHFLRQRAQAEIAADLGVSAATVSRRIDKGLERLRSRLKKAGVVVTAAALGAFLAQNSAAAAPAALAAELGKMILAGFTGGGGAGASAAAGGAFLSTVVGKLVVAAIVVVAAVGGFVGYRAVTAPRPPAPVARAIPKKAKEEAVKKAWGGWDYPKLRLEGDPRRHDSFSATMLGAARLRGHEADYETIYALSTNGFAPDVCPAEDCRDTWRRLGRGRCIDLVADYLGVNVRPIEFPTPSPRPAPDEKGRTWGTPAHNQWLAERMKVCAGVIRRALDGNMVVVCDGGWRTADFSLWGVVTAADPVTGRIAGRVLGDSREHVMDHERHYWILMGSKAPISPREADQEMLRRAVARIRGDRAPFLPGEIVFGLPAMDLWIKQMEKPAFQQDDPASSAGNARACADYSCQGAKSTASYLRKRLAAFPAAGKPHVEATIRHYERIAQLLDPFTVWEKGRGYQAFMGDVAKQNEHVDSVLMPVKAEMAAAADQLTCADAATRLRPLRYTVSEADADPKHVRELEIKVTEVLGSAAQVGVGQVFVVRGNYRSKGDAIAWLRLSGLGRTTGAERSVDAGENEFEITGGMLEVVPGKEKILHVHLADREGRYLGVRLRIEVAGFAGPAQVVREGDKVFLPGIEDYKIGAGQTECTTIAALAGAMQALGEPYSYEFLMGVSGAAFRLQVSQPNWCPSSPHAMCGFPCGDEAREAMPYESVTHWIKKEDPATWDRARATAVASVDKGIPVLICSEESGIVLGYTDGGKTLLGRAPYLHKQGYQPLKRVNILVNTKLDGRDEYAPWAITTLTPGRKTPPRREILTESLRRAVTLANTERFPGHSAAAKDFHYLSGFKAWETWIAQLRDAKRWEAMDANALPGEMLANGCIYYGLVDARYSADMYLKSIAGEFPGDAAAHLRTAADLYKALAEKHLCQRCPTEIAPVPHMLKKGETWTQEMRNAQADILEKALVLEKQALAEIGKALAAGR